MVTTTAISFDNKVFLPAKEYADKQGIDLKKYLETILSQFASLQRHETFKTRQLKDLPDDIQYIISLGKENKYTEKQDGNEDERYEYLKQKYNL